MTEHVPMKLGNAYGWEVRKDGSGWIWRSWARGNAESGREDSEIHAQFLAGEKLADLKGQSPPDDRLV